MNGHLVQLAMNMSEPLPLSDDIVSKNGAVDRSSELQRYLCPDN